MIETALRVAWIYKTDPFSVLARPHHAIVDVLRRTNDLIEDLKASYG